MSLSHHNPPFVRLGDFGQSTFSSSNKSSLGVSTIKSTFSKHGTPVYCAPEILLVDVATGTRAKPSRRSDVYAMSLVTYEIMCGTHQPPFHDIVDEQQLVEQVAKRDRRPPLSAISADTPSSISKVVELGWHKERSLRPSALEFYTTADQCFNVVSSNMFDIFLSHPWAKKSVMRHIKRFLASIGYKTFYDQDNMQWDLKRSMEEGVLRCKVVLACISRDYEKSKNCMFELGEASKLAGKPIVTLSTDANPVSWAGSDRRFGDLKQLCGINGQGKMLFDIGDLCARPEWNETDESLIPKQLIDELHLKLSELVKYLRDSHINCVPSLSSSNSAIDALFESKIKADIEAWSKRKAEMRITSAADAYRYLCKFDDDFDISALGGEAVVVSQLDSINTLQNGNKAFNEDLVCLGACEQLAKLFRLPVLSQQEGILAKLFGIVNFLCRYDGETNATNMDSHQVRLAQCGILEVSVSCLTTHINRPLVAEYACMAIRSLSSNDTNRDKLGSLGCCEQLVRVLTIHQDNKDVSKWACVAIGNMAFNDANRDKLGSLGCCEQLVRVLTIHQDNKDVSKYACGAIRNKSINNDSNRDKLGSLGCCEQLVRVLTIHQDDKDVSEYACKAICAMAVNNANRDKLGSLGCCEQLVRVLTIHQDDKDVSGYACGAIRNMAYNDANSDKLGSLGCCEQLVRVLTIHQDNEDVSKRACGAIGNMAYNDSNSDKLGSLGCCEQLVRVLTIHQDNKDVSEYACWAIRNMSINNDSNRDKLGSLGCCEQLVRVLTIHQDNQDVSEYACSAIGNMAANSRNKAKFNSLNCSAILNTVKARHKENAEVSKVARVALSNLR
jgi:serine/threonine protein kinase